MTPPNITAFTLVAKAVLGRLYLAFPEPVDLRAADLLAEAEAGPQFQEKLSQPGARLNLAATTIRFLETEGFIRYASDAGGLSFHGVTLTSKGFSALRKTPAVLEPKASIGDRLLEPLSEGALSGLIQAILS